MPEDFHRKCFSLDSPPFYTLQLGDTYQLTEKPEYLCDKEELPSDSIVYLTSKRPTWLAGRFINTNWDMPELLAKEKEIVEGDLLKFKCLGLF